MLKPLSTRGGEGPIVAAFSMITNLRIAFVSSSTVYRCEQRLDPAPLCGVGGEHEAGGRQGARLDPLLRHRFLLLLVLGLGVRA